VSPSPRSSRALGSLALGALLLACVSGPQVDTASFDVRAFGASGRRGDDARPAIQRAIDACAAAGGGTVVFPPGEYTSGSIELRSHVRVVIASGATVYSAKGKAAFPSEALFHGQDLENVTLEGRGTLDGCAAYEWREHDIDDSYIRPNQLRMEAAGKSLLRAFPTKDSVGHMVRLVRCNDVQIRDLSLVRSPSWNIHLWGCERVVIEGVDIRSSLTEGVWADGIDPDGCRDVRISNCVIETGDDALVFYSSPLFGPARPCEDITVTNCRLTSSSSALKFGDGNQNCIRRVTIDNCAITNSNRGVAFMVFDGGTVSDVVLSNLTIECTRRDWFWWGDGDPIHFDARQRSDLDARLRSPDEPPPGSIRNVLIRGVIARGTGTSSLAGHPASPLENVVIDGLELHVAADPSAPYETLESALVLRHARDVELRDVAVFWEAPESTRGRSALAAEDVQGLRLDNVAARQAPGVSEAPAIALTDVVGALVRNCRALSGTTEFLRVKGAASSDIQLLANDLRAAQLPWKLEGPAPGVLRSNGDLLREP
jgi:glycosyl hydrolase family 28